MTRTYGYGGDASATLDITWPGGTTDKPTTLAVSAQNTDSYSMVFNNFKSSIGYGPTVRTWFLASAGNEIIANSGWGDTEIEVPEEGYLLLHSNPNALADALIITWDQKPDRILLHSDPNANSFRDVELVFSGDATPKVTALPFLETDGNMSWPIQVAENIVSRGVYGARGYDPTYVCGFEGLGTAALAASAYIFKKYDSPLAEQAEKLAIKAMEAAYSASYERGVTPDCTNDRIAACGYLADLGYEQYIDMAEYWGRFTLAQQRADGSFPGFDTRKVLALQRTYDVTGSQEFRDAVDRYKQTIAYYPDRIEYNGNTMTGHVLFLGGTELGYLGYDGDTANLANVFDFAANCIDDTGDFSCSDINPYFLGWSLNGTMEKKYDRSEKKVLVGRTESALYHADGSYEILDYPTAYINNPYRFSKRTLLQYGDINNDSKSDATDALWALQDTVGLRSLGGAGIMAGDVDGSGSINATDALYILQKTVNLRDEYPIESDGSDS